ncbi:hypothetical protein CDL15_Pgr012038 [Punica granatum]|uniref:GDSL esterase/lipase At5g55050-like n=1 Tax=Punica granatum TaxID=22663 RepID=A0A218XLY6_PUNGR|nr:hypothetical protein CDL15_Pgr012038 [Punica granatum]
MLPEIFVFGDSFVDIGNNNDLPLSLAKANFLHNGIDFPSQKATGRFSNGKNIDLLAEKVGCQVHRLTFLSTQTQVHHTFAVSVSLLTQSIPLWQQVEYYLKVHEHLTKRLGSAHAQKHLSKSLFFIVFGSNNILDYSRSIDQNKPPKMHVNQMTTLLKAKLKILHTHGARKFMVVGLPPVGCCPAQRIQNETRGCREDTNTWTVMYKEALESMSQELKSEVKDMSYSYSHTYPLIHGFIQDPASNGGERGLLWARRPECPIPVPANFNALLQQAADGA